MFSEVKKVYLGFDPDDTGKAAAIKVKEALGSKARILELPETLPKCDWTEYLAVRNHTWRDVRDLLSAASGRRIFSVADAAAQWRKLRTDQPGIKLGFAELDAQLKPGLMPGQVCIPLAKTGTGKTVFLCNVAYNTRSRRSLIVSLEMTAPEVYNLLQRIYRFWHPFASEHAMHEDLKHIGIVDENRLSEQDLDALVEEYTEEHGGPPELVMIDYLGYLARGMRGSDSYERTGAAAMMVKGIAKRVGAAVITPHQVNRGAQDGKPLQADDARDSGVIEETGDFVFGLFKPDEAIDAATGQPGAVTGNVSLSILKSRHGGKGKVFLLKHSAASLVMVDQGNRRACIKIDQENARINRGEHYDDIIASQSQTQLVLVPGA
jgi:replicative DNA helicase